MFNINPKDFGIDTTKIAQGVEDFSATAHNCRAISANLLSVSATFKALADALEAKFRLPPDAS